MMKRCPKKEIAIYILQKNINPFGRNKVVRSDRLSVSSRTAASGVTMIFRTTDERRTLRAYGQVFPNPRRERERERMMRYPWIFPGATDDLESGAVRKVPMARSIIYSCLETKRNESNVFAVSLSPSSDKKWRALRLNSVERRVRRAKGIYISTKTKYLVDPASSICLSQRLSHACLSTSR